MFVNVPTGCMVMRISSPEAKVNPLGGTIPVPVIRKHPAGKLVSRNRYSDSSPAVRFICSNDYRIERLARILDVEEKEAQKILGKIDKEQRDFFKKAFGKKDASPYEFDMIINCEFITEPQQAAEIVALAFKKKFAVEI